MQQQQPQNPPPGTPQTDPTMAMEAEQESNIQDSSDAAVQPEQPNNLPPGTQEDQVLQRLFQQKQDAHPDSTGEHAQGINSATPHQSIDGAIAAMDQKLEVALDQGAQILNSMGKSSMSKAAGA